LIAFQRRKSLLVSRSVMMFVAGARFRCAGSCARGGDSARPDNIRKAGIPAKRCIQPRKPHSPQKGVKKTVASAILYLKLPNGRYITVPIYESFIRRQWLLSTSDGQENVDKSHTEAS